MNVIVELLTGMREFTPKDAKREEEFSLNMPGSSTVTDVIKELKIPDDFTFRVIVNTNSIPLDSKLKDQDKLVFVPFF